MSSLLKYNSGQLLNAMKYLLGENREVVNWQPIYISLFVTYKCNYYCDMCLTHSRKFKNKYGQTPTQDMTFDFFKKVLNKYNNALCVNIIGNGEPLLHKDFFKMVDYAANKMKMNVFSSSNGLLVKDYINDLVKSPMKNFNVSIISHNSDEYFRMTGMDPKNFDKICENVIDLINKRNDYGSSLKITSCFILDKVNYKELINMINFADKLGTDRIAFFHFLPTPIKGFSAEERCLYDNDKLILETFKKIDTLPKNLKHKISLPPLLDDTMVKNRYCSTWFYNLSVDGDENIGGCSCQLIDLNSGKFFESNDPFNNQYFQEMRRIFLSLNSNLLEPCTWCYNNSKYIYSWANEKNVIIKKLKKLFSMSLYK